MKRITVGSFEKGEFKYLVIPKMLAVHPDYRELSANARLIYGVLLDKVTLSIKYRRYNDEKEVVVFCTHENIAELVGISEKTSERTMPELEKAGLIESVRRGKKQSNMYYVSLPNEMTAEQIESLSKNQKQFIGIKVKEDSEQTICPDTNHENESEETICQSEPTICPSEGTKCQSEGTKCPTNYTDLTNLKKLTSSPIEGDQNFVDQSEDIETGMEDVSFSNPEPMDNDHVSPWNDVSFEVYINKPVSKETPSKQDTLHGMSEMDSPSSPQCAATPLLPQA